MLQAQQQLFPAENALARIRFQRLATLVELYKTLGGGWKLPDAQWPGPQAETRPGDPPRSTGDAPSPGSR